MLHSPSIWFSSGSKSYSNTVHLVSKPDGKSNDQSNDNSDILLPPIKRPKECKVFLSSRVGLLSVLTWCGMAWPEMGAIAAPTLPNSTSHLEAVADTRLATTTFLWVNPILGDDGWGDGSERSPFRTLSRALQVAQSGTVIHLLPGLYSSETGEQFPLQLKPGVTVQGDANSNGRGIVIRGSGSFLSPTFARQNVTLLGANNATLTGVTITNPEGRGYGLWIESSHPTVSHNTFTQNVHDGIAVTGASNPVIQNNYFQRNGANGITIYGTSRPQIIGNIFEDTGFGINIGQQAAPVLMDNRLWHNRSGVIVQGQAQPILRRNVMEYNEQDGLVAIANSRPDLGTTTDPGQNRFTDNGQFAINGQVALSPLMVVGNTVDIAQVSDNVRVVASAGENGSTAMVANAPISPPAPVTSVPPVVSEADAAVEPGSEAIAPPPQPQAASVTAPLPNPANTLPDTSPLSPQTFSDIVNIPVRPAVAESATVAPQPTLTTAQAAEQAEGDRSILSILLPVPSAGDRPNLFLNSGENQTEAVGNNGTSDQGEMIPLFGIPGVGEETAATNGATVENGGDRSILSILLPVPDSPPNTNALLNRQEMLIGSTLPSPRNGNTPDAIEIPVIFPGESPDVTNLSASRAELSPVDGTTSSLLPSLSPSPTAAALPSVAIAIPSAAPTPLIPNRAPTSQPPSNLLPVPGTIVPEGHIGSLSTVAVQSNPLNEALLSAVSTTSTYNGALGGRSSLRYRVLVMDNTDEARQIVNSISPDAFITRVDGQTMWQVGAYSAFENANAIARQLVNYGLQVEVQRMN